MSFCILEHDYTLYFIGSPSYNVSYYNSISIWPSYIVILLQCKYTIALFCNLALYKIWCMRCDATCPHFALEVGAIINMINVESWFQWLQLYIDISPRLS